MTGAQVDTSIYKNQQPSGESSPMQTLSNVLTLKRQLNGVPQYGNSDTLSSLGAGAAYKPTYGSD